MKFAVECRFSSKCQSGPWNDKHANCFDSGPKPTRINLDMNRPPVPSSMYMQDQFRGARDAWSNAPQIWSYN